MHIRAKAKHKPTNLGRTGRKKHSSSTFLVSVSSLSPKVDINKLGFRTTEELPTLDETIGQERALRALDFGLNIQTDGYNIFVAGSPGSGRNTALSSALDKVASSLPTPSDWCYIYNFTQPLNPQAIKVPNGMGPQLELDMDHLIEDLKGRIPQIFASAEYQQVSILNEKELRQEQERIFQEMKDEAEKLGMSLNITSTGMNLVPAKTPTEETNSGSILRGKGDLAKNEQKMLQYVHRRSLELRQLEKHHDMARQRMDRKFVIDLIKPYFDDLKNRYRYLSDIVGYLGQVELDIPCHLHLFRGDDPLNQPSRESQIPRVANPQDEWVRYKVNTLVHNQPDRGAPIIFEMSPNYYNLFGKIDHQLRMGGASTDLKQIRPGALHRANGGFLVLQAEDALTSPFVWQALKQTLRARRIQVENLGEHSSSLPVPTLNPVPIPFDGKIILVGNPNIYRQLLLQDEDFRKFFKVKAEFANSMNFDEHNAKKYASFIVNRVHSEGLRHFKVDAVGRVIEHSSRLVEDQSKLSTRFSDIAALITESNYWAQVRNHSLVTRTDVEQAIKEKEYRSNLIEEEILESYANGTFKISVDGYAVGQINGLAIINIGDHSFGKPTRLTARIALGKGDITNIDQDSQLGGPIHGKGFNILLGYLVGKYGFDSTLPIRGTIAFEQSYSEVDGDSASSVELYALLSSLANIPINQALAVTGSVNQHGEIQAVGGVTKKIEGFYSVCKANGLTGNQGVIIPESNVRNLALNEEVKTAIANGKFHLYAVETIDEGMALLSGLAITAKSDDSSPDMSKLDKIILQALEEFREHARNDRSDDPIRSTDV